uniref:Uncharacterized protein n=1 Tax=Mycena chlorophos TaxID=658473 RepID=A0ABQ0L1Y3_MYCCL|nr:predicted protein [Mycena chlorophos]
MRQRDQTSCLSTTASTKNQQKNMVNTRGRPAPVDAPAASSSQRPAARRQRVADADADASTRQQPESRKRKRNTTDPSSVPAAPPKPRSGKGKAKKTKRPPASKRAPVAETADDAAQPSKKARVDGSESPLTSQDEDDDDNDVEGNPVAAEELAGQEGEGVGSSAATVAAPSGNNVEVADASLVADAPAHAASPVADAPALDAPAPDASTTIVPGNESREIADALIIADAHPPDASATIVPGSLDLADASMVADAPADDASASVVLPFAFQSPSLNIADASRVDDASAQPMELDPTVVEPTAVAAAVLPATNVTEPDVAMVDAVPLPLMERSGVPAISESPASPDSTPGSPPRDLDLDAARQEMAVDEVAVDDDKSVQSLALSVIDRADEYSVTLEQRYIAQRTPPLSDDDADSGSVNVEPPVKVSDGDRVEVSDPVNVSDPVDVSDNDAAPVGGNVSDSDSSSGSEYGGPGGKQSGDESEDEESEDEESDEDVGPKKAAPAPKKDAPAPKIVAPTQPALTPPPLTPGRSAASVKEDNGSEPWRFGGRWSHQDRVYARNNFSSYWDPQRRDWRRWDDFDGEVYSANYEPVIRFEHVDSPWAVDAGDISLQSKGKAKERQLPADWQE